MQKLFSIMPADELAIPGASAKTDFMFSLFLNILDVVQQQALRLEKSGQHLTDDICKYFIMKENLCILIQNLLILFIVVQLTESHNLFRLWAKQVMAITWSSNDPVLGSIGFSELKYIFNQLWEIL